MSRSRPHRPECDIRPVSSTGEPAARLGIDVADLPSARLHAHILAPLPSGSFPGVDDSEVYAFLDQHATSD